MSVAALGSLLGGYEQGQERAQSQKERAQYLLMLQQRQKRSDDAADAAQTAGAAEDFDMGSSFSTDQPAGTSGSTLGTDGEAGDPVTRVFGANAAPLTGPGAPQRPTPPPPMGGGPGGAPAMPPGTASMPSQPPQQMAMPGATPMPGPGGPPPGGMPPPQQMPQRPGMQPGQMPPQRPQPMQAGQPGGPPPGQRPSGPQPGQPPQAPQAQQPAVNGFEQALTTIKDTQAKLAVPEAQQVLQDPDVQDVRKRYHAYVEKLRADGVDPSGQTGRKPDQVEMARLKILHGELSVAMVSASKHISDDRKVQWEAGHALADVYARKEAAEQAMKRVEAQQAGATERKGMGGGGGGGAGGGAPVGDFNSWTDEQKQGLKKEYEQFGPNALPWARSMKGGSQQIEAFDKWRLGEGGKGRGSGTADYKADTKALGNMQQTADVQQQRYSTLDKNVDLMLKNAQKYGLKGSTPINTVVNALRGTTDVDAKAFLAAIATVQREYGKLADGGSGAAAAHVESLKNAGETIGSNFTYDQLQAVAKTLKADGKNVIDSYAEQLSKIKGRISGSKSDDAGGALGFKGSDGTEYSDADVQHVMAAKHMTRQQVMDAANKAQ